MKVGVLGGGQLGQMLALAGHPLGINVDCFEDVAGAPASFGGTVTEGKLSDIDLLRAWAKSQSVLTYESENFPVELVGDLAESSPVYPGVKALAAAQDRWYEKRLFDDLDIPVTPFRLCTSGSEVSTAWNEIGPDVVFKTRTGGYDGKGQVVVRAESDLPAAEQLLAETNTHVIAEAMVDFVSEVSVIGVRGRNGEIRLYSPTTNLHRNGILRTSIAASGLTPERQRLANDYVIKIMNHLDYVGTLGLEMFVTPSQVLANEVAPRVHNSGHWTIEGAETSQFENHLRAICGLPLGSTELRCPSAMINIIGSAPDAIELLKIPGVHLHTYQKQARPGRKLGHVTICGPDRATLNQRIDAVQVLINS